MAEILLFHHAQGLTPGVLDFAETLRQSGHTVHTPDLYEGRTFDDLDEGVGFAQEKGFGALLERGVQAAEGLPAELIYAGFSLGVLPAQKLAQTRAGAKGACCSTPASRRPSSVALGRRRSGPDPLDGRRPVLHRRGRRGRRPSLVAESSDAELFLYPASSTCSPTTACRRTTSPPPPCSPSECSVFSTQFSSQARVQHWAVDGDRRSAS